MELFERFTDRARRVTVLAQEEARLLNHNYIGTEHILLGLIHEGEGIGAQTLAKLGVTLDKARDVLTEIMGEGNSSPSGHIPFTPRAKKVLELSLREALQLGHNYIGTEHILLGLIREGEGVACQMLVRCGADLTRSRQMVIQSLAGYEKPKETPRTADMEGSTAYRITREGVRKEPMAQTQLTFQVSVSEAVAILGWAKSVAELAGDLRKDHPLTILLSIFEGL
jgi:ATP-dependent Clp protease ATP-binding subunit ClpC